MAREDIVPTFKRFSNRVIIFFFFSFFLIFTKWRSATVVTMLETQRPANGIPCTRTGGWECFFFLSFFSSSFFTRVVYTIASK